jgi:hypothetical protein
VDWEIGDLLAGEVGHDCCSWPLVRQTVKLRLRLRKCFGTGGEIEAVRGIANWAAK